MKNIQKQRVIYNNTEELESFVISLSQKPEDIPAEIKNNITEIFFHKRKEWEHEQEYRLLKRCPNTTKEEYLLLGHSLRFIILSSKLRNIDEVGYFKNIEVIEEKVKKVEEARKMGKAGAVPVLIYGNGLYDYALCTDDGEEELWNSKGGYNVKVIGKICELAEM
jgi:hypothetical protein